jgi:flagellar basal body rod protein FlgB
MADALDTPAFKKRKVEFQTQSKRRTDNSNPYGRSSWA